MSITNFTPGPWMLRGYQIRANNGLGAHVATYQISEADGRLIAAAPDLLAALRDLVHSLEEGAHADVLATRIAWARVALKQAGAL